MKRFLVLALCAGVALTACEGEESEQASAEHMAVSPAPAAAPAADALAEPELVVETPPPEEASVPRSAPRPIARPTTPPVNIPLLAYRYQYRIEAPAKSIDVLVGKHEAACQAAGPAVCQVTEAAVRHEFKRLVTGTLSIRARPDWMNAFRAGLAADAEGVGGQISTSNTGTDDLSASIVDTEAAIRAKLILRERLEELMARRTGKLSDMMEVEQQLAQVRGEIDAAQSNLAMMKNRVRMSSLTIDYGPKGSLAEDGAWEPVASAVRASQGLAASVVAGLILVIAGLTPIALAGGLIVFLVRRLRKPKPASATAA